MAGGAHRRHLRARRLARTVPSGTAMVRRPAVDRTSNRRRPAPPLPPAVGPQGRRDGQAVGGTQAAHQTDPAADPARDPRRRPAPSGRPRIPGRRLSRGGSPCSPACARQRPPATS
jgi:hypothetical protein